ncbi:hypothetical protein SDRG_17373, partial [Saprolegnia diclina VS20]
LIWSFPQFVQPFPSISLNQSLLSYCYNPPYLVTMVIAVDVSGAQVLTASSTYRTALLRSLGPALGLPDLSAFVLAVQSINATAGTVSIVAMLPSSVSSVYPTSLSFNNAITAREMTTAFAKSVYDAASVTAGAVCTPGYYGPTCSTPCTTSACRVVSSCVSVGGTALACSSCNAGYWGSPLCTKTCTVPSTARCALAICDQTTGFFLSCSGACYAGYWGPSCQTPCPVPWQCATGTAVTCDPVTSSVVTCKACAAGYWGKTCRQVCLPSLTCASGASGNVIACPACLDGFWGDLCQHACVGYPTCASDALVSCDAVTGGMPVCHECMAGYWGSTCQSICMASSECAPGATLTCNWGTGALATCQGCVTNYWGDAMQPSHEPCPLVQ